MLDFMRRNARSWGIRAALGTIILVFIFFMGGGGQLGAGPKPLVTVGEVEIQRADYEMAARRNENYFRRQFEGQVSEEMLKSLNIPKMTLDQLVDGAVLRVEAERLGLGIPEEAIRDQLRRVPAFQQNGQFSPGLYKETLRAQGLSPSAFEESVRQDLLEAQLADVIRRGAHAGEDEAWQEYRQANRKLTLSYVAVDSASFEKDVATGDEALAKFFESNQEDYRRPATVKVRYVPYRVADIATRIEVSEVDLNEYYDLNKNAEFQRQESISAHHILKKMDKEAGEEARKAARAAIDAIAARLAAGGDFEEIARTESEDPGSAAKGGDLGSFPRGDMVAAFEEAAFALEPGQTSGVVETDFGFHIIRVDARQAAGVSSFDEVKDTIRAKLAREKATERAFDDSAEDSARIGDGATLESVAGARGVAIAETAPFADGAIVPGIGNAPAFAKAAFALEKVGDVSRPVKVGSDYFIFALAEKVDSAVPPLAEVRTEVEADFRAEAAIDLARKRADELLEKVKAGAALADVAAEAQLEVKKAEDVSVSGNFLRGVGSLPGLSDVAFATTKDGEALGRSFVAGPKAYLFVRDGVTEASREAFDAVKDEEVKRLEKAREQEALGEFLRSLKEKAAIQYDLAQLRPLLGDNSPLEQ